MDCLFCKLAEGEHVVYRDDLVAAFRDINPQAPTHVLIVPRAHVASVDEMGDAHGPTLAAMLGAAQKLARESGAEKEGYRLVFNHGPAAGQTVFHVHMHLLAGRQLGWPPG